MKRSISVTISAIVVLIGSVLSVGSGTLTAIVVLLLPSRPSLGPQPTGAALFGALVMVLPGAWGIATGIGLLLLKSWARISIIVFASLLALSVLGAPMMLLIPFPTTPDMDGFLWSFRIGMAFFYLVLAAIGIWWLLLFTRPSVKLQFSGGVPVADEGGRPLSISIIAWLLLLGAVCLPFGLIARMPTILMGFLLTGWAAALAYASLLIVLLYLGIGLLRLKPVARTLTVYYSVFGIVNMALFYLRPGYEARMAALMQASSNLFNLPVPPMVFPGLPLFVITTVVMAVQIYFLVTRKHAFDRTAAIASPSLS
jgi:hypothetical protein